MEFGGRGGRVDHIVLDVSLLYSLSIPKATISTKYDGQAINDNGGDVSTLHVCSTFQGQLSRSLFLSKTDYPVCHLVPVLINLEVRTEPDRRALFLVRRSSVQRRYPIASSLPLQESSRKPTGLSALILAIAIDSYIFL